MISIFGQIKDDLWPLFVPMLGQLMVITRILRGDPVEAIHFVVPFLINTAISVGAIVVIAKLLTKEKIIFWAGVIPDSQKRLDQALARRLGRKWPGRRAKWRSKRKV